MPECFLWGGKREDATYFYLDQRATTCALNYFSFLQKQRFVHRQSISSIYRCLFSKLFAFTALFRHLAQGSVFFNFFWSDSRLEGGYWERLDRNYRQEPDRFPQESVFGQEWSLFNQLNLWLTSRRKIWKSLKVQRKCTFETGQLCFSAGIMSKPRSQLEADRENVITSSNHQNKIKAESIRLCLCFIGGIKQTALIVSWYSLIETVFLNSLLLVKQPEDQSEGSIFCD